VRVCLCVCLCLLVSEYDCVCVYSMTVCVYSMTVCVCVCVCNKYPYFGKAQFLFVVLSEQKLKISNVLSNHNPERITKRVCL